MPNQDGSRVCHRLSEFGAHFKRQTLSLAAILPWQCGATRCEEARRGHNKNKNHRPGNLLAILLSYRGSLSEIQFCGTLKEPARRLHDLTKTRPRGFLQLDQRRLDGCGRASRTESQHGDGIHEEDIPSLDTRPAGISAEHPSCFTSVR